MNTIFSFRLRNARKIRGYTLQELAEHLGVSKQMISKYENGLSMPDSPNLIKLAQLLGEKIDYFFRPTTFNLENVSFRKKSKYSESKIGVLKAKILKQLENYLSIEDILEIPFEFTNPLKNKQIKTFLDAETAAEQLHKLWHLGNAPIHNIVSLLENYEIKVIEIDEPDQNLFDGLSAFVENKYPVIVYNKNFTIERKRFTLFHELAHLLLNIDEALTAETEKVCNRFAGAMLLPREVIYKEIGVKRDNLSVNELLNFQKQYGISISAMVYRLADLEIISENKRAYYFTHRNLRPDYKNYCDMVRFEGNESSERYISLVFRALSQELISISKASALLDKSIDEVQNELAVI